VCEEEQEKAGSLEERPPTEICTSFMLDHLLLLPLVEAESQIWQNWSPARWSGMGKVNMPSLLFFMFMSSVLLAILL
jgi:hypothetical protein